MKNQEIKIGNAIIAKFMGNILLPKDEPEAIDVFQIGVWQDEYADNKLISRSRLDDAYAVYRNTIPYHSDWNLLMGAVDKIWVKGYIANIGNCDCEIKKVFGAGREAKEYRELSVGHTTIEAVWKAVVAFIKWYNEQKKAE